MIGCEDLVERMPLVAAGRAGWTPEEMRHLGECPSCAETWHVVRAAARLGSEVEAEVDSGRIGQVVLARLEAARRPDRWRRVGWLTGLATAAGLALLIWTQVPTGSGDASAQAFLLPVEELDSLTTPELEMVLESLDPPIGQASDVEPPALGDLDDQQLERVLRSLES